MSVDPTDRRIEKIGDQIVELLVITTKNGDRLDTLNGTVSAIVAEIGGVEPPPLQGRRPTLRTRIHKLENDQIAAIIAQETLEKVRKSDKRLWSVRQKRVLFGIAIGTFTLALLRFLGFGG